MRNVLTFLTVKFRVILLVFGSLLVFQPAIAQQSKIDSLKNELTRHPQKDTLRVYLLNELAFSYFSRDLSKSLEYLGEAEEIANAIQFKKGIARSTYILGITEAIQSNFEQALSQYSKALKLYQEVDDKKGIASCYNAMGITYKNKGELRESIGYFKKAIAIEEEIESENLSASLLNLGTTYQVLGEFEESVSYLKEALTIAEANQNEQRVAYSLNNLGTVYFDQGNYPLALEQFKKSLFTNEKLGDSISMAHNHINLGSIYRIQKEYDKAISSFETSLGIYERINNKQGISSTLNGIGTIHEERGDYQSARDYYLNALKISKEIDTKSETPFILNNIGGVYLKTKDYNVALDYFEEAKQISEEIESKETLCGAYIGLAAAFSKLNVNNLALSNALAANEIAESSGFLSFQKEAAGILSEIYTATGDYKKALTSYQRFKLLNDSLFNQNNIKRIAQLEYEYKYKQALDSANIRELNLTKTVLSTSQDLAKTRQNYLWAIIGILVTSILSGSYVFYQKYNNVKIRNQNIVTEQKLLRSQMTPHFIFNSLSVLQGMILDKEATKSVTYLSKFSKLLRLVLENSRDKIVPLIRELDAIDNYMSLQNLAADQSYDNSLVVDESIDRNLFLIPPMLIQPFIENAIEHAFPIDQDHRQIAVRLRLEEKKLICSITDNGMGIDSKPNQPSANKKSLARTITGERLKMLAKDFKTDGDILIEDRKKYNEHGTRVTLIVPYRLAQHT
ncbi:tetratricopeptide repeat-containing sensor histidine kinase [Algoriphagus litoralis]|uniref:tetratricopeptide repeat-containing sensor histidine kinase n=1 Tax=Algoriphagus litoralis TaxID=2202829 RepID=UPI0018E536FA|nr:tetratricopeptide repeat protein [Algoriphagus litoralis]